jgi:hypothetical protein
MADSSMKEFAVRFPWFGVVMITAGAVLLLSRIHLLHVDWLTAVWAVVAAVGIWKLVRGVAGRRRGEAFWGLVLTAIGVYEVLANGDFVELWPGVEFSALMMTVGAGFLLMFVLVPRGWRVLIPAVFFLAIGGAMLAAELEYADRWSVARLVSTYWPVAIIALGAAMLIPGDTRPKG